jgi:endoribonuclease Dicer
MFFFKLDAITCISFLVAHLSSAFPLFYYIVSLPAFLQGYIRCEAFNPKTWIIPGIGYDACSNSKLIILSPNMYSVRKMSIKSKRITDSVEALIGAYLSAGGEQAAYLFLISLGMDIEFHKMPVERKITIKSEEFINLSSLEAMLGYEFNDPSLLVEALTHGSYQIAGTTAC